MEWKDLQPIAVILAAIISGVITAITTLRLQNIKRNDDIDLKAFEYSLSKHFKEFEQKLLKDNSYLTEKGKNEAFKEDLEEINKKLEGIKTDYLKRGTLYKLQAEKEFKVYSKLWIISTELRLAFEDLRPLFDPQREETNWQDLWDKRYKVFSDCHNRLLKEIEIQKPFYPEYLYPALRNLVGKSLVELIDFKQSFELNGSMSLEGKSRGKKNLDEFVDNLEKVCEIIRNRITES